MNNKCKKCDCKIKLHLKDEKLHIRINTDKTNISFPNTTIVNKVVEDPYEGSYTVVPKNYDQVLPTKNKGMKHDVTVTEIPYFEVSNAFGKTLIIGE